MEDDSRVTDSGTQLIVTDGEFDPNFEYNFTVSVRDIRMEVGRKSVEYTQTVRVVDEPIPVITITCDKYCDNHYIHPGDRWVLHANCDSCLAYPVPVFYRWIITRTGGPPDEFNWASSTEAGTNEGENLRTIEVLPNMLKPGAEYKVEVMAKYEPKTMEDYENLRALVESQ